MNRIYRVVWNEAKRIWVAVCEVARGRGKGGGRRRPVLKGLLLLVPLALLSPPATASPGGGQVTAGSGTITRSGATTTINQASQNLALSWQTFNVAPAETVNFNQPDATALAVNRIHDSNGSRILGHLNANGQIWLINPNGVLFGKAARVNVAGLVASTLDTADGSTFTGTGTGSVVNDGTIKASSYAALLGNSVTNNGLISARLGTVALGAGNRVNLTFSGNSLVKLQVDRSVVDSLAANHGLIRADGGRVIMSAGARDTLLASVVNNDGIVQAQTVQNHNGVITLLGGMAAGRVNVGGTLDASAPNGGDGGFIETSAHNVKVADGARVTTLAANGQSGTWLIDPVDYTIAASGGDMTGSALTTNLGSGNVTIQSSSGGTGTAGDINVNDAVSWSSNLLTLTAAHAININAVMTGSGSASLAMNPATANGGDAAVAGGTINVGLDSSGFTGRVDFSGSGTLKINGTTYTVISSLGSAGSTSGTDLQGINGGLSGHYVLGANIDATATSTNTTSWGTNGFTPIGSQSGFGFSGVFDGLGHTISNLYINRGSTNTVGLFGYVPGGTVRNVGLVGGSVTGKQLVGGLVGKTSNSVTISNVYATGSVSGSNAVGGLVGDNYNSTISNAYATGSVTGNVVGGLVGYDYSGTISNAYASGAVSGTSNVGGLVGDNSQGTISNAYATGAVSGTSNVGGLVGSNEGSNATISNAYTTGTVTGGTASSNVGGLVGYNNSNGPISDVYATGAVSGTKNVGGLVGYNFAFSGTVSNAYVTGAVSGTSNVGGLVGKDDSGTFNNAYVTGAVTGGNVLMGQGWAGYLGTNCYWDVDTTGYTYSNYVSSDHGLTTAQLAAALPAGFSSSTWANAGNQTTPYLVANASFSTVSGHVILGTDSSSTPTYYDVIQNMTQLQDINSTGLSRNYVLGTNLTDTTTTGSGFTPIGNSTTSFTGTFEGLNHTVTGLYINLPSNNNVGLFGTVGAGGTVRNLGLVGGSVTAGTFVGGLVGSNNGTISDSYGSVSVSGNFQLGGLVGTNTGTIMGAYATGSVTGKGYLGGLAGQNGGTISNAYATGAVSGIRYDGGLTGQNNGTISNAYATGSVSGSNAGGLAGRNSGTINNAYATGSVNVSSQVGGLVGYNTISGTTNNGYWDTTTSGQASSAGGTGLTTVQLAAALPTGFSSSTWANGGNQTTPYLLANASFSTVSGHVILGSDTSSTPTYYDVIQNMTQLQNINTTGLSGDYVLGTNLTDTTTTGSGFTPIGNSTTSFTGTFDGLGHTITGLYINRTSSYIGQFGAVGTNGIVRNIGLVGGSVKGGNLVGELVGYNRGTISNAYATGSVTGTNAVGGLVGANSNGTVSHAYATGSVTGGSLTTGGLVGVNSSGTVSNSYATGSVTGGSWVGGLVGNNVGGGTIKNAYATGSVIGTNSNVGGLVGLNNGTISNIYATGTVTGGSQAGGLVGWNNSGSVNNGYWDTTTDTKVSGGIGGGGGSGGATGLTDTQMQQSSNFTGFDFTNTWVQYDGHTYPLLRYFMTPLTITSSAQTKTYDGTSTVTLNTPTYSVAGADTSGYLFGLSSAYGSNAINANTYSTSDLWSDQQGYIITQSGIGALTINPAPLTIGGITAANKTYDATTAATVSTAGATYTGLLAGDAVTVAATGAFADKNVGTGKTVTLASTYSGADVGNYAITDQAGTTANITPAALSIGGIAAANKTYDGTTAATVNTAGATYTGLLAGDAVTVAATGTFADKNVGTGKTVTLASIYSGADVGNYAITDQAGTTANITPAALSIDGITAANKAYDGTTAATVNTSGATYTGLIGGDAVTVAATGTFADKNVGTGKKVTLVSTYSGADIGNYAITDQASTTASINPAPLTVTANNDSKTYDGIAYSGGNGVTYAGFVNGETSSVLSGTLAYGGTAQGAVDVGSYAIIPAGLTSNNYTLQYIDGTLEIVSAAPPPTLQYTIAQIESGLGTSKTGTGTGTSGTGTFGTGTSGTGTSGTGTSGTGATNTGQSTGSGNGTGAPGQPGNTPGNHGLKVAGFTPVLHVLYGGVKLPGNILNQN